MEKTKVALLGAGFIAEIHAESYRRFVPDAEVTAVYTRDTEKAAGFAKRHGIAKSFDNVDKLLREADADVIDVCLPNHLHYSACKAAAAAGRHVIIEKPLCLKVEQAEEMIAEIRKNGKQLMYAENISFAPKYERVREIIKSGAIGDVFMLSHAEQHSGPHSPWFYRSETAGGGVLMDMGCHAVGWFFHMLGEAKVKSVYADLSRVMHDTDAEDHSLLILEFESPSGKVTCLAQNSWCRQGGMDDHMEVMGTKGLASADLFLGNSARVHSRGGYNYASEKAGDTKGWTFPTFEEAFNQGYPQELQYFIGCVRSGEPARPAGEDGLAVLEVLYAAYASARQGRKIALPFQARVTKPWDLWKK